MASTILIGSLKDINLHVDAYIEANNFLSYETMSFDEKIKIEDARAIRHELSFVVNTKKLFILRNEVTLEAQNALLKTLEEIGENVHFIFCVEFADQLLPTIHSRSRIVHVDSLYDAENKFRNILVSKVDGTDSTYFFENLTGAIDKENIFAFLEGLRSLILDPQVSFEHKKLYFQYCKKTLKLSNLSNVNNVNERIVLENIFE